VPLLAGCASESEYDALQSEYEALQSEYEALQSEYESLQVGYEMLQSEHATLVLETTSLETELEIVQSDLTNVQTDYNVLETDYEILLVDYDLLDTSHEAIKEEVAQIEGAYPPRYFSSATELRDWLAQDDISDRASVDAVLVYESALELQRRALRDGYIINANITTVGMTPTTYNIYCTAVTEDNSLYHWNAETDNISYWLVDIRDFQWVVGIG